MPRYVMFTRLAPDSLRDPKRFYDTAREIGKRLREEIPGIRWIDSYAVAGPYDVVDVFEAPTDEAAMQAACLIRSAAGVTTETYPAVAWDQFLENVRKLARS